MAFDEILHDLIKRDGVELKDLADAAGIAVSSLGNYIKGKRYPDYKTIVLIAEYFGVTTDFLLEYQPKLSIGNDENKLLRVYRKLTEEQKELYIKQGMIYITQNKKDA